MAVYACADLHGRYDLYQKIKAFVQPEDIIYFLGDANDRGPDGWKLVKAIYEDPQFIYLKGNHEDMLIQAMLEYIKNNYEFTGENFATLMRNGGSNTFYEWAAESTKSRTDWMVKLRGLNESQKYHSKELGVSFILTHAGCTPWHGQIVAEDDLLWDRSHFLDLWPPHDENDNIIVVHGHTPILLMPNFCFIKKEEILEPGALWYCNNHKVNLDVGSVWNDFTLLLNLDTLDEEIIY